MNSDLRDKVSSAATAIEITLGIIILLACVVGSIGLVYTTEPEPATDSEKKHWPNA